MSTSDEVVNDDKALSSETPSTFVHPSKRRMFDKNVSLEEYMYYAKITREQEEADYRSPDIPKTGLLQQVLGRGPTPPAAPHALAGTPGADMKEKQAIGGEPEGNSRRGSRFGHASISNDEWLNASRAMRTASWGAGFYLIATDILGPYGVGFALGTLGWGPGIVLYTVFAFMAGYSGYILWQVYLGLDSYEFPIRNYGDIVYRTMGTIPRYFVNVLQSIQLLLLVGQVSIQNGQGISQISKFRLCYVVCVIIFVIAGFVIGQVRSLRNFGFISMVAVGLNLMVIFISMGVMAHSEPNYQIGVLGSAGSAVDPTSITPDANGVYPPVKHYNGLPDPKSLVGSINGLMSGVFAYGGAQIFPEIMAEMRRPYDFIKSMWIAQLFIWIVYLVYGCYVYYWQGQYSFTISYLGLSIYGFQVACNMMAVISGLIAAGLYGNIGIKVLYNNVLMELFNAPPITTKQGRMLFGAIVPIYWSIAFVIAAAIPDYFGFVSVIAAFCILQFSYTFPPILHLVYTMQKESALEGEGFDARTGLTKHIDSGVKRYIRGFMARKWYINVWHVIHAGGALATAGLGAYAAIQGMIDAFKNPQVNAFTCKSPLNLAAA